MADRRIEVVSRRALVTVAGGSLIAPLVATQVAAQTGPDRDAIAADRAAIEAILSQAGEVQTGASVTYLPDGDDAVVRSLQDKARENVSVLDFGASPSASAAVNAAAFQKAVDALPSVDYPRTGPVLLIPPGIYALTAFPALPSKSITISAYGAKIAFTGSVAFDLGQDSYLTDLGDGYHSFILQGLECQFAAGSTGIKNRGMRHIILQDVRTQGGLHALDTEGAFAMSSATNCRFQSTTGKVVRLRQRNNLFSFYSCAHLAGLDGGTLIDTSSLGGSPDGENKGIKFYSCDWEGCQGAIDIEGNSGNIQFYGPWSENCTSYFLRIDNTAGTDNKYGILISGGEITGDGVDVIIGTDPNGTTVDGVVVMGNEFTDADLIVNGKVQNFAEFGNKRSGSSTFTFAAASLASNTGSVVTRYPTAPVEPFGTPASGSQGDIRYANGRLWFKAAGGWYLVQGGTTEDFTNQMAYLPGGATPNVAGLQAAQTNNGGATSITSFVGGYAGQFLTLRGLDGGNTTVAHGTNIRLAGGANFVVGDDDTITLFCVNGTKWVETARSNNT